MNRDRLLPRILYTGAGLVILVVLIAFFVFIPGVLLDNTPGTSPAGSIFGMTILIIPHFVFLYIFRAAIRANKHGGHLRKGYYITSGIGLLVLGFMILDGAVAFSRHVNTCFLAISLFTCVGSDVVAAILAFSARSFLGKLIPA
jgi:hypothetical protein